MASGKLLRRIGVDGAEYRWWIRPQFSDPILHLQIVDGRLDGRRRLRVTVLSDSFFLWLSPPYQVQAMRRRPFNVTCVTPALVARLIPHGLALGWRPTLKGPDLRCALEGPDDAPLRVLAPI